MGSAQGFRTRKYHGWFSTVVGRGERAWLADFELRVDGRALWPHCYLSPDGPLVSPDPAAEGIPFRYSTNREGSPSWVWQLPEGELQLQVAGRPGVGIELTLSWRSSRPHSKSAGKSPFPPARIELRPLCAGRALHEVGGRECVWRPEGDGSLDRATLELASSSKAAAIHMVFAGPWAWRDDPLWYRNFHYSEERLRGYDSEEDLHSPGVLTVTLEHEQSAAWLLSERRPEGAPVLEPKTSARRKAPRLRAAPPTPGSLDFILTEPAGIVAGFPWFGEWSRDTFISLPGVSSAWISSGARPEEVWDWCAEVLERWSRWIDSEGMLPNLIGTGGEPQWEAADGTLWWAHSLASLWSMSLGQVSLFGPFRRISEEFSSRLDRALEAIEAGEHRHLRLDVESGLLHVTDEHATWMDARVDGAAVTPRTGALPEINALYFQARCLQSAWRPRDGAAEGEEFGRLARLGRTMLSEAIGEFERPNRVFLHSVPLAPSFVLQDAAALSRDLHRVAEKFRTPVGLRTLDPSDPRYRPRCVGTQRERDLSYHQGPVWGWLGGHFEMANARMKSAPMDSETPPAVAPVMPIERQIAEIFDAEPPFTPRGAPAQAWSVACLDEARARRELKIDQKISQVLADRWSDRPRLRVRRNKLGRGLENEGNS